MLKMDSPASDLEAYLERINYSGSLNPTEELLASLHRALSGMLNLSPVTGVFCRLLFGAKKNGSHTATQNIVHVSTKAYQRGGATAIVSCLYKSAVWHSTFIAYLMFGDCKLIQEINGFTVCVPYNITRLQ